MAEKKLKCPRCVKGAPGWIVTFGDLMSLLLTFFVLLLSFAQMDIVKFQQMAGSIQDAFGVRQIHVINPTPTGKDLIEKEFDQRIVLIHLMEELRILFSGQIESNEVEVVEVEEGFIVRFNKNVLFTEDDSTMRPEAGDMLARMSELVMNKQSRIKTFIRITGHTDNRPPSQFGPFPSNWAMGMYYASTITAHLASQDGMDPSLLQARSRGEYDPIASNDDDEGRTRNRRVEIVITRESEPVNVNPLLVELETEEVQGGAGTAAGKGEAGAAVGKGEAGSGRADAPFVPGIPEAVDPIPPVVGDAPVTGTGI